MHKMRKIGSIITVSSGGTPNRKREDYYSGGTIPWVKTGDLKGKFIEKPKEYITPVGLQNSSAKLFPKNTVLVAMYGATIGACSILDEEAATNQACAALLPCSELEPAFLYFYFSSIKNDLVNKGVGGAQPNISLGILKNLEIPLPPLEEQKKIAAILDAADDYRQKTKALIDKYDQLIQSLFLDMFGDPVSNPKGWEVKTLGDVVIIKNGKNQRLVEDVNGKYPIYGSGGIMGRASSFISDANSIVLGRKGNINKPIHVSEKFWHVDTAFGLNPNKDLISHYYLHLFCTRYNFEQHNQTVTIPSLTKTAILQVMIPLPPMELQNEFAERVIQIEKQKQQAEASLVKAEELFNSLLQRAFKGELTN